MSGHSWIWIIWYVFLAALLWAAVSRRSRRRHDLGHRGDAGSFGARYGGPDFGIPPGWPQGHGRAPHDEPRSDSSLETRERGP
jgi:hypothetical protein